MRYFVRIIHGLPVTAWRVVNHSGETVSTHKTYRLAKEAAQKLTGDDHAND